MSKEKAVKTTMIITIVLMVFGLAGVLLMPNIRGCFEKTPVHRVFTENTSDITINQCDDFDIEFQLNGEKLGEGWVLSSGYNQSVLSILQGDQVGNLQTWTFYGKNKGSVTLSFQKGTLTRTFEIQVK